MNTRNRRWAAKLPGFAGTDVLSVDKHLSKAGDYIIGEMCCRAGDDRKVFIRMPNKYCHILLEI